MKNILKSKLFWLLAIVVAVIFFVVGVSLSKTYKSEMRILLIPKSEVAARNIDQILRNAEEIPKSLSFYNKMLELNSDIEDNLADMPDSQRKEAWNSKIKIKNIKESEIIKIDTFSDDQLQAEIISRQIAFSDITVLSRYYDITTDLDMRIIDGPITCFAYRINYGILFLFSLLAGIIIGGAVYLIAKFFPKKEDFVKLQSLEKYFQLTKKEKTEEESEYFPISDEELESLDDIYTFEKKGAAPDNLPIAEESAFESTEEKKEPAIYPKSSENISQIVTREATPEEVKARLNKLLNN